MRTVDIRQAMLHQPLWFLSIIVAIKDTVLGLGFVVGTSYMVQSKLYQNFDSLIPGSTGPIAGWLLLALGVWKIGMAVFGQLHLTRLALRIGALMWLFSTILYCLNGQWLFGAAISLPFSMLAGYLAFAFRDQIDFQYRARPETSAQDTLVARESSVPSNDQDPFLQP